MAATTMVSADCIISARGFGKRYGAVQAAQGLDLEVRRGELYGLIGPDGAGKSSLMKAVAGVLAFDEGELAVFGQPLRSERTAEVIKDRIGLMPQGLGQNLYGDLSVEENIDFFARLRLVPPAQAQARKEELLAMTRLAAFRARPMKNLSGGMKQKLGLVCTLIHAPQLIILDEPTTGVDPVSRRDFWRILAELINRDGLSALVSTAYMDEASRFHRMSLLHEGRVLACGTPDEILALRPGVVVQLAVSDQAVARPRLAARFPQLEALGGVLRLFAADESADSATAAVRALLPPQMIHSLSVQDAELEDVFVAMLAPGAVTASAAEPAPPRAAGVDTGDYAIEARGLVKRFGDFVANSDVSFCVKPGEIFGLLGANGAGKTTAIKMLTGILPPSAGSGRVAGADMKSAGMLIKSRIGYMSQAFSLYLDLSVVENIRLYAGIYGLSRRDSAARLDWIIAMAGLHGFEHSLAASLPMGLRQRLALGCALVHQPRVLFLDEPTSGVDPLGRRAFWDILFRLSREDGVALLVTTHYMSEAEHCDHIALMFAGKVVADATPQQLKDEVVRDAGALYEIAGVLPSGLSQTLAAAGFEHVSVYGRRLHVLCHQRERLQQCLAQLAPQAQLRERAIAMEDVFVQKVSALEAAQAGEAR